MPDTPEANDPECATRVRKLFDRAMCLPTADREALVRREAANDPAVLEQALQLLADADADAHAEADADTKPFRPEAFAPNGDRSTSRPPSDKVQSTATSELMEKLAKAPKLDTNRYELQGEIDKGGMGAILKIEDHHLSRRLAMKVMLEREAPRDEYEEQLAHQLLGRFLEEAQVTSQLDHPGVVPVHELGLDEDGKVYFTMRLVRGRTASDIFGLAHQDKEDWNTTRALEVILKVCDTMAFAHEKGVLHRDLKPANVMVGRFGEVYVMDWGLAKIVGQADRRDVRIRPEDLAPLSSVDSTRKRDTDSNDGASVVSMDGQRIGTPSYMPPEQAMSEPVDKRADVYAIGAMLYELLTGRAPYTTPGLREPAYRILKYVAEGPPDAITKLHAGVPAELVAIVDKAMARDREQRYRDTVELAADLRAFVAQRAVAAYRTGALVELKLWVKRNKPLAASLMAAVLILVAGVTFTTIYAQEANLQANENARLATAEKLARQAADEQAAANALLAAEKGALADEKTALAEQVQQQASDLEVRVRNFDQLSGVVQYERATEVEAVLYPAWPDKVDAMDAWLADTDVLLAKEESIRATIRSLRDKALPVTAEQLDAERRAHARYPEYEALQQRVAAMRLAQELRSGRTTWIEPELPAELRGKTASECNQIAWPMVDWEKPDRPRGQERLALACARAAVAGADTDTDRATFGDTLAWALFFCGRDDEAIAQARRNIELAGERKADFEPYLSELQQRVEALRGDGGEQAVAAAERELQVLGDELRNWRFGTEQDEQAAGFLHGALTELLGKFELLKVTKAGVVQRRGWAERLGQLTVAHPNARHTWAAVRSAIAANEKYAGCEIPLTDEDVATRWLGLVPIGENPVTGLWEFYELRSAWDGVADPRAIAIPEHEADGSIKMTGDTGIVFVLLPGGTVTLGSQKDDEKAPLYDAQHRDNEKLHDVTLSPFLLARHELTQGQWARLWTWDAELRDPSQYKAGNTVAGGKLTLSNPVESVDWTMSDTLMTRHGMLLPTEAQWEYGCRGGTTTPSFVEQSALKTVSNLASQDAKPYGVTWPLESWRDGYVAHAPVGSYGANAFGLYDVHGNVFEWCQDWFGDYGSERPGDGQRSVRSSAIRVSRGGSFSNAAAYARSAYRDNYAPSVRYNDLGLRPSRIITF